MDYMAISSQGLWITTVSPTVSQRMCSIVTRGLWLGPFGEVSYTRRKGLSRMGMRTKR